MPLNGTLKQLKWHTHIHTHTHPLAAAWRIAHRRRVGSGRRLGPDQGSGVAMVMENLNRFLVYFGG